MSALPYAPPMRILFYTTMAVVLSVLLFFVHRYLWRRWVRDTELTGSTRRAATIGLFALGGVVPLAMVLGRLLGRGVSQPLAIVAFSWMGFVVFALLVLFAADLARWLSRKLRRPEVTPTLVAGPAPEPDRRTFLARAVAGASAVTAGGVFAIGTRNALGEIDVVRFPVALPRLPKALDGLKVVQLTDVHIGPLLDGRFLEGVVEKVNAEKPDLVVITGDLVDGSTSLIGADVARLAKLQSRFGTYFVTGNHEYYSGAEDWVAFLQKLGVRTLLNEHVRIGDAGARFTLAGITDKQAGMFVPAHAPDLGRALAGRRPEDALLLLAHRPNPIKEAAAQGVGLQLSGHTHGGQFFPVTAIGALVHPYNAGLHQHNADTQIYVSRGTGFWGPPLRILAPAEITSITLTA